MPVPASTPVTPYVAEDNQISDPGESDIESENDWFDEQDVAAPRQASKFVEALAIEVRTQYYFMKTRSNITYRDRCGMFLPLTVQHRSTARIVQNMLTRHRQAVA